MDVEYVCGAQGPYACRVCLATDIKLDHLFIEGLQDDFFNITGIQISPSDGLPHYICYICRELLKKAAAFRYKSNTTQSILNVQPVTINYIKSIITTPLKCLSQTVTLTISFPEDANSEETETLDLIDDSFVKEEKVEKSKQKQLILQLDTNEWLNESKKNVKSEVEVSYSDDDNTESNEVILVKKAKIKNKNAKREQKRKVKFPKKQKDDVDMDTQGVREYLISTNTANLYAQMLHTYIIKKYVDKTNDYPIRRYVNELIPLSDSIKEEEDVTAEIDQLETPNQIDPNKKILYDFIKEKYVQKNRPPKNRRARDLVRMKFRKDKTVVKTQTVIAELQKKHNMEVKHLSMEEQIAEVKARAESHKYENATFKCLVCYRGFAFERTFDDHMRTHDPAVSGSAKCEVCQTRFLNKRKLLKHQISHKYRFTCKECGGVFKSSHSAKLHAKSHTGTNYECEYCFRVFSKYASRMNHIRNKHGSVACDICYELMAPSGLKLHYTLAHKKTFKCVTCEKVFNDASALNTHTQNAMDAVCNPDDRSCTKCGESFSSESRLMAHIVEHRKNRRRMARFRPQTQKSSNSVETHRRRGRPRVNDEDSDRLKGEEKRDADAEKCVMCEMCGDTFISAAAMRYHQRIHTGEKPYACPMCPKRFRLKGLLTMHVNTHTGNRPHKCTICPKDFKSHTALYRHQLVHTKERRHRCTMCDKTFQTSTCVKVHIRTVHLKIPMPPRVRNRKKRAE